MTHLHRKQVRFELGEIQLVEWEHKANVALWKKDSMESIAPIPNGKMAVGYFHGRIEIFSADGNMHHTVLKDVNICDLAFLSDGVCVVRSMNNDILLYTRECKKKNGVRFYTLSIEEGGLGGFAVDCDNCIYVGYKKAKKIQVFSPMGGKAVMEISCGLYEPQQIFVLNPSKMLVVKAHRNAICVLDRKGNEMHELTKDKGTFVHPTVCQNGSIIIAHISKDLYRVSIEEYTSKLKYVKNLITDHLIGKTERNWYHLQQFSSGELALCSTDSLYIFCERSLVLRLVQVSPTSVVV